MKADRHVWTKNVVTVLYDNRKVWLKLDSHLMNFFGEPGKILRVSWKLWTQELFWLNVAGGFYLWTESIVNAFLFAEFNIYQVSTNGGGAKGAIAHLPPGGKDFFFV